MRAGTDRFKASRERFDQLIGFVAGDARSLTHAQLEDQLEVMGRELMRQLYQDHLDLRALREEQVQVYAAGGVHHASVQENRSRTLATVFGPVTHSRMAYRRHASHNLHPADAALNLPVERHSHGLRRMAAEGAARGSFDDTAAAIRRRTGAPIGKRQVEQLACRAACDVDAFYATREHEPTSDRDVLVLSVDGKGIVVLPDALRKQTARQARSSKLATRLSKGEKRNRKRMAEVGVVYDLQPAPPRIASDVITTTDSAERVPAPRAKNKWLIASVVDDAAEVISQVFDEADRRDPRRRRTRVALVDGNNHQIDRINAESTQRSTPVTVLIDFVHVAEYVWAAAWSFFDEGDPAAERWVATRLLAILDGNATAVATALRRAATRRKLTDKQRHNTDRCATYLTNKAPYLDYPTALQNGWPIATGIIEGACRHLVKDRMDITGARWSLHGAEAILKLRAIRSNGDLDEYWTWHLNQEHQRVHAQHYDTACA